MSERKILRSHDEPRPPPGAKRFGIQSVAGGEIRDATAAEPPAGAIAAL